MNVWAKGPLLVSLLGDPLNGLNDPRLEKKLPGTLHVPPATQCTERLVKRNLCRSYWNTVSFQNWKNLMANMDEARKNYDWGNVHYLNLRRYLECLWCLHLKVSTGILPYFKLNHEKKWLRQVPRICRPWPYCAQTDSVSRKRITDEK